MRLFRMCSPKEIEAIKTDSPFKITYGAPLYRFIGNLIDGNHYPTLNKLVDDFEKVRINPSLLKANKDKELIYKVFTDLPKEIPLRGGDKNNRRLLFKKFHSNSSKENAYNMPDLVRISLDVANASWDYTWLYTIKIGSFFKDPNIFDEIAGTPIVNNKNRVCLAIDFPSEIALKFKGDGLYNLNGSILPSLSDLTRFEEYALPMYQIKKENVLGSYKLGSEEDKKFRKEYKNDKTL